ncbi:hypothetical protein RclHR1_10470010 [Rhizophagus clarus]|uniref:BTB domain-containing protein n=1 Tax=Rhizophagus clarus TaxID=94130 RepID=A0A2Z6Q2U7_9GLOM|nr:hypothetical protein RclHR1_10470010 [Rhizophagus clarus]GES93119.1 hypothetical protein GLOIN_2v1870949 [Rhizophagus clarus]
MTSIFHHNFLKDVTTILDNADDYDVIIQVGQDYYKREFRAHSVILRARCPYFKSALTANWITKKNNMILFNKPNITSTIFNMILKYINSGELVLTNHTGKQLFDLLIASDELLLEELFTYVQDYLIKEKVDWIRKNFDLIFKLINCKKLQCYCFEIICESSHPFLISKTFSLIDVNILSDILKRDDLQVKEINLWDYLIKWGINQLPDLKDEKIDNIKWNYKKFKRLRETLESLIPLIRFMNISRVDFFNKVRPYMLIIPNDIYNEIEEFHYLVTLPKIKILLPRTGRIDSNIIKEELINILANLIDMKNVNDTRTGNDPFYKFNLIYRGSCDGFDNTKFKYKCNRRVASLILIEVQHSNIIFGGYSSIGFCSSKDNSNSNHFIFSFEKCKVMQTMKVGRANVGQTMKVSRAKSNPMNDNKRGFDFNGELYMVNQILHLENFGRYKRISNSSIYVIKEVETFIVVCN